MAWNVVGLAAWMVTWWISEAVPIPITALLPMVAFPMMGVFPIFESTAPYASPIIFLFMGGFMIALGLEKHNLHKRIALNLIRLTGTNANGIILGFMIATAFLSMWISNTATAVMMLPIAMSVIGLLNESANDASVELGPAGEGRKRSFDLFALGLFLSIAYAANVGGTATIIGTPPNVVMVGYLRQFLDYDMDFSRWLLIGIPISLTLLLLTFLMITKVLFRNGLGRIPGSDRVLRNQLEELGPMKRAEKLVALVFGLTAFGWIFKKYINMVVGTELLSDTVTAMAGGILMFLMPLEMKRGKFLMQWEDTTRLPWGILILFGGGMCLAKGMETTGLIQLIGSAIAGQENITPLFLVAALTLTMLFMTELMSNVALVTIFVPVVIGIGQGLDFDPLLLVIPVTLASSCAFMMPISTPPNAIVFASGKIRMKDMMKAGIFLNLISVAVLVFATFTLINWIFGK